MDEEEENNSENYIIYSQIREFILLLQPIYYYIINSIIVLLLLSYSFLLRYCVSIYLLICSKYFVNTILLKIVLIIQNNEHADFHQLRTHVHVYLTALSLNFIWLLSVPLVLIYTDYDAVKTKYMLIFVCLIYLVDNCLNFLFTLIICCRYNHNLIIGLLNILSFNRNSSRIVSINNIPTKIYSDICDEIDEEKGLMLRQVNCSVCLDQYDSEDEVKILACDHIFHKECIDNWLIRKFSCPVCRQEF